MFAEQQQVAPSEHLFQLSPNYKRPQPPLWEKAVLFTEKLKNLSVKQFDLAYSFSSAKELVKKYGEERGLFLAALGAMMNVLTIRQEMLGSMDTQEIVTQILRGEDDSLFIRSTHYTEAKNLDDEVLFDQVPKPYRDRFKLEVTQLKNLFRTLANQAQEIDLSLPQEQLEEKLRTAGFREQEIPITPEMLATVPSLIENIHTIDDFYTTTQQGKKIKAWMGPSQSITVSSPSWVHRRGETSLVWGGELCVISGTAEMFVRQQGKFSKAQEKQLLQFLGYQQERPHTFSSEEELMLFVNLVHQENYTQPHQLLEFIIQQAGSLETVPKIDPNIEPGEIDIRDYFPHIHDLFRFEWEQMQGHQRLWKKTSSHLGIISNLVKHKIARNEPVALEQIAEEYKSLHLKADAEFKRRMEKFAVDVDPGFAIKIDFSLLDCVVGTPSSFIAKSGNIFSSIEFSYGFGTMEMVKRYHENGLQTREEVVEFCEKVGLSPDLYSTYGKCVMCYEKIHKQTFIWSTEDGGCDVCPVCQFMDSNGITEDSFKNNEEEQSSIDEIGELINEMPLSSEQKVRARFLLNTLLKPSIGFDEFMVNDTPLSSEAQRKLPDKILTQIQQSTNPIAALEAVVGKIVMSDEDDALNENNTEELVVEEVASAPLPAEPILSV